MGQDGGTNIPHITPDGELCVDVDPSDHSSDHGGGNAGQKGNG